MSRDERQIQRKRRNISAINAYLHEFNFITVCFRLILVMACGGVIGYGRSQKRQNAGFRTYMLTSIGAAMSVLSENIGSESVGSENTGQ